MDAMTQMAGVLGSIPQTPRERRAAINRRQYRVTRERWQTYEAIRALRRLRDLLLSEITAPMSMRELLRARHADH